MGIKVRNGGVWVEVSDGATGATGADENFRRDCHPLRGAHAFQEKLTP